MELKGSKTEANLKAAFAGESQASVKYQYYASKANKDGYVQIGNIFTETAGNEKEHAKIWFKLLHDNGVPGTVANLNDAADGENYEWTDMPMTTEMMIWNTFITMPSPSTVSGNTTFVAPLPR